MLLGISSASTVMCLGEACRKCLISARRRRDGGAMIMLLAALLTSHSVGFKGRILTQRNC